MKAWRGSTLTKANDITSDFLDLIRWLSLAEILMMIVYNSYLVITTDINISVAISYIQVMIRTMIGARKLVLQSSFYSLNTTSHMMISNMIE